MKIGIDQKPRWTIITEGIAHSQASSAPLPCSTFSRSDALRKGLVGRMARLLEEKRAYWGLGMGLFQREYLYLDRYLTLYID
jgi:hypothetical protein